MIIVVTQDIGYTPSGMIVRRIINELVQRKVAISVISETNEGDLGLVGISNLFLLGFGGGHNLKKLNKTFFWLTGISIELLIKKTKVKSICRKNNSLLSDVTAVWGFTSSSNLFVVEMLPLIGKISRAKRKGLHFFDLLPPKEHWKGNRRIRRWEQKIVEQRINGLDFISTISSKMLKEQLAIIKERDIKSGVFYNPGNNIEIGMLSKPTNIGSIIVLYTGLLLPIRRPDLFFKAIADFDATIWQFLFVGNNKREDWFEGDHLGDLIKFLPNTNDLLPLYNQSSILLDLDVMVDDVYISSKFTNYLGLNRYIFSVSPIGSAARELVDGCETVIFSEGGYENIRNGLEEIKKHLQFGRGNKSISEDRESIRKKLDLKPLIEEIIGDTTDK